MGYNYQDSKMESQQEYFGKVRTDNTETLYNALKRIEELEQENALLKGRNEGFEKQIMGLLIKYEEFYKRFPDLKNAMDKAEEVLKENARLKLELEALDGQIPWKDIKDKSEVLGKLTEAKEIIRQLLLLPYANNEEVNADVTSILDRAEQFLKE